MTKGVGGSDYEEVLHSIKTWHKTADPISITEYRDRYIRVQELIKTYKADALLLNGGASLQYFSGLVWSDFAVDRLFGLIIPKNGAPHYIVPRFEKGTICNGVILEGELHCWDEHEDPYEISASLMRKLGINRLAVDPLSPFTVSENIRRTLPSVGLIDATPIIDGCRAKKSPAEIALLQQAKDITLEVHRLTAGVLCAGMSTTKVKSFVNDAHRAMGAGGTKFDIVLFGEATSYPHGIRSEQKLKEGDIVLIDMGCSVSGYISDITRTYVFGENIDDDVRDVWTLEKQAQAAAFEAAQLGSPCENVDKAARRIIEDAGFGPDYELPGLPHRTGHGIGLSVHEAPYLVRGNKTPLEAGMCFSNEPMIVVPNRFGVRLEDHFFMTETGPQWFTKPSHSIDDPFG
ncbi:MAG: Xaa-Pro peptidase family protein [Pseudomonadota bacterium]